LKRASNLKKRDREAAQGQDSATDQERSAYLAERAGHEAPPADIDDVVASEQLAFKPFAGADVYARRSQAAELGRSLGLAAATEVEVSRRRR